MAGAIVARRRPRQAASALERDHAGASRSEDERVHLVRAGLAWPRLPTVEPVGDVAERRQLLDQLARRAPRHPAEHERVDLAHDRGAILRQRPPTSLDAEPLGALDVDLDEADRPPDWQVVEL